MRAQALLFAVFLGVALPVAAQSTGDAQLTRDDGIRAVLAGDYAKAVRVLQPLAEEANPPDPVAQFFMGSLYYSGLGVKMDQFHACSLFLNAASVENPFNELAARLVRVFQEQMQGQDCPKIWSVPHAAIFVLAPNHRVTITETETTISLNGAERVVPAVKQNPFTVFAPSVYAIVDVEGATPLRRHFIQSFIWFRGPRDHSWHLVWTLNEVVGLDLVERARDADAVTSDSPDGPYDLDVSHLASIRGGPSGEVEWTFGTGADARHGTVVLWRGNEGDLGCCLRDPAGAQCSSDGAG